MEEKSGGERIAKNTLLLYFRQILIMFVSLYTVRVVLNVLGAEDYGIFNVAAGVVTMFSFLSGSMATASQRYFSYDLGKNNYDKLSETFSVTLEIYFILIFIVLFFAETIGLWFVNQKLVIPDTRKVAANIVYQASIVSFIFTLITTPYMACIIAHENMSVYAYVSIIETTLRLLIVYLLQIFSFDKLSMYGILLCVIAVLNTSIYRFYCKKNYKECRFRFVRNKPLLKELISYSGWNMFGASVGIVKNQIINILLNLFFGPLVNAARSVAAQVCSAVQSFGQNFSTAMRPQVIKNYASNNIEDCMTLVNRGSKFTYYLMLFFSLPLIYEMDFVLTLWLKNFPPETILFSRLVLIDCLIECLSYQIMTLAQATGKIKLYQSLVGGIQFLNLPISYLLLKLGLPAYSVLIVSIIMTINSSIARLIVVKRLVAFSIKKYLIFVIQPCFWVTLIPTGILFIINYFFSSGVVRFFITGFVSVLILLLCVYFLGISNIERKQVKMLLAKVFKRGRDVN